MLELLVAAALAPWANPLSFSALPGWHTGKSGTVHSVSVGPDQRIPTPPRSSAWIVTDNVRYRDDASADPPNATLARLPSDGVIVWAVIERPRPGQTPLPRKLWKAKRFECCEGAEVAGGEYDLVGAGRSGAYSVIVRIYFGSRPTRALRAKAQAALDHLRLPAPRSPAT